MFTHPGHVSSPAKVCLQGKLFNQPEFQRSQTILEDRCAPLQASLVLLSHQPGGRQGAPVFVTAQRHSPLMPTNGLWLPWEGGVAVRPPHSAMSPMAGNCGARDCQAWPLFKKEPLGKSNYNWGIKTRIIKKI